MNIVGTQNPGLMAGKVTNARLFRPRIPMVRPSPVAPLSLEKKLAVVNALLTQSMKATVISMPPSQIVLTPAQAVQGANCIEVSGWWYPSTGVVSVGNLADSYIVFLYPGLASGTYLLDISVSGGGNLGFGWYNGGASSLQPATLVSQSGHFLYPFIGGGEYTFLIWPPSTGAVFAWTKTELTKVA